MEQTSKKETRTKVSSMLFRVVFAIIPAALIAYIVALWAIPAAYAQRGYYAIGGEWCLIVTTFAVTSLALWRAFDR